MTLPPDANNEEAFSVSEPVEEELREALQTPAREFTPADWDRKRREIGEH